MATKIKLTRIGKMRTPYYRIIVADARAKRDGRSIEEIGRYDPKADPSIIEVDSDRAQYWLGVGAQPTEAVAALLRVTGDWQQFKGLPAPPPMLVAEPKSDKHAAFADAAAVAAGLNTDKGSATTPKKKAAPKAKAERPADTATAADAETAAEGQPLVEGAAAASDETSASADTSATTGDTDASES